jgi:hypothetical protein
MGAAEVRKRGAGPGVMAKRDRKGREEDGDGSGAMRARTRCVLPCFFL